MPDEERAYQYEHVLDQTNTCFDSGLSIHTSVSAMIMLNIYNKFISFDFEKSPVFPTACVREISSRELSPDAVWHQHPIRLERVPCGSSGTDDDLGDVDDCRTTDPWPRRRAERSGHRRLGPV